MKIVTSEQMRALDRAAIEKHGIPSLDLMERAGMGLAQVVRPHITAGGGRVLIIAGRGNNGGDGLVAARHLMESGIDVGVIVLSASGGLSEDSKVNLEKLSDVDVKCVEDTASFDEAARGIETTALIIDAVLGTGLAREVEGLAARAIDLMNSSGTPVVSADVPSGLASDTGEVLGRAVRAALTVTFGLPKRGFFAGAGPDHVGEISIVDIGIPAEETSGIDSDLELITPDDFIGAFRTRRRASHKGSFGHVAVFAGSKGHLGAGYLASLAALRSGCGLVTYCLPESAFAKFDARYPEVMCDALPDGGSGAFTEAGLDRALEISSGKGAVAIGPAIGTADGTAGFVNSFLFKSGAPCVVDADALNVLDVDGLTHRHAAAVLTPHPGEMARLMGAAAEEIQADRTGFARALADRTGAVTVLKGSMSVVAEPRGVAWINPTGNPGMASAGMGDALTGMIASFIAQGIDALTAARAAVYLHGLAGDMAAVEMGQESVTATEVIARIGRAMEECKQSGHPER